MTRIRVRALVEGRVQGVFFRDSMRQRAEQLGLTGIARNLSDGSVEVVFEGEEANVEAALDFLRLGPPLARVERVEVTRGACTDEFSSFRVTR